MKRGRGRRATDVLEERLAVDVLHDDPEVWIRVVARKQFYKRFVQTVTESAHMKRLVRKER